MKRRTRNLLIGAVVAVAAFGVVWYIFLRETEIGQYITLALGGDRGATHALLGPPVSRPPEPRHEGELGMFGPASTDPHGVGVTPGALQDF